MLPVEDQHLQNREECGASGGDLRYFPLALSFQDDFVTNGRVVVIVLFYYNRRENIQFLQPPIISDTPTSRGQNDRCL